MHRFSKGLDKDTFYLIKIEDINKKFIESMQKLTRWLEVCWYRPWSDNDYIVTSIGKPWYGISAYKSYYQKSELGLLQNDNEIKNKFEKPDPGLPAKWKKHVLKREAMFLETIYYDEIKENKYEFQFIKNDGDKKRGLLCGILPFSGEIPKIKWYFTVRRDKKIKDVIIKATYLPVLLVSYVFSRVQMYLLYISGRLATRPK